MQQFEWLPACLCSFKSKLGNVCVLLSVVSFFLLSISYLIYFHYPIGRKTLWWDQRMKLQKYQMDSLDPLSLKSSRYFTGFRGPPKQAICPFCYKLFYDKSTMNRHVSKRVCLGLQFRVSFAVKRSVVATGD